MEYSTTGMKIALLQNPSRIVLLLLLILLLFTIVPLCYTKIDINPMFFFKNSFKTDFFSSTSYGRENQYWSAIGISTTKTCDLFTGEWVPNPQGPTYTNTTCWAIHEHQNCIKYGRPDRDFLNWRWKPDECQLPPFNPAQFLELLRGKSLAFVGDSIGRNHLQSLICLLSRVTYPEDISFVEDEQFQRWLYKDYNLTIATFWSPFLVRSNEADPLGPTLTGLFNIYLDEFDDGWTTQIHEFDYVIISAGHWFFRPSIFYQDGQIVGCHYCQSPNITDLTMYHSYRLAFRTAFKAINRLGGFNGAIYLRTFAPSHFENGLWNEGGNCLRTRPFRRDETRLEGFSLELYMIQLEEFNKAKQEGEEKGVKFRLIDTTQAMLLRPDGHPSRYGHWPHENVTLYNDCVHWCLPGPIDVWNDFLLQMIKTERIGSHHAGKTYTIGRTLG